MKPNSNFRFKAIIGLVSALNTGSIACFWDDVPPMPQYPMNPITMSLAFHRILCWPFTMFICWSLYTSEDVVHGNHGNQVKMTGVYRFTKFTCCSWGLNTLYFNLILVHSAAVCFGFDGIPVFVHVLFEVCLTSGFLVSLVFHFILVPIARKKAPERLPKLLGWRSMCLHCANIIMLVIEAFLAGWHVVPRHWLYGLAYCNAYLVFTIWWFHQNGIFYYFFMDYKRFKWAPLAYIFLFVGHAAVWFLCSQLTIYNR